jgi:hypothetical protein
MLYVYHMRNSGLIIGGLALAVVGVLWYKGFFCNYQATQILCKHTPPSAGVVRTEMNIASRFPYQHQLAHSQGYHS